MSAATSQARAWQAVSPMPAVPKRPARLAPEQRRAQLLDATLRLAARAGFAGMTVEAVAREAGVTRPVIYDLFGDLDGLLDALGDREEARAMAALARVIPDDPGERDPEAVLVDAVGGYLEAVRDEPATWRLVLLPPSGSPPALRERMHRNREATADRIAALLAWGLARRGGPAGLDHELLARLLIASAEDAARLVLEDPRAHPPARMAAAAGAMLALLPPTGAPPPR
jgi:AcrR family transcriptional regulator